MQWKALALAGFLYLLWCTGSPLANVSRPPHAASIEAKCRALKLQAGPPEDFHDRRTRPHLIQNAKLWTGGNNGTEVVNGDVLIDKGLIMDIYGSELVVIDAKGAWITPGIVDIHSHLGNAASPELEGALDDNSPKGTIQPWLRSLDGLNTHDDAYSLSSIAGGVTAALTGGQAFAIKLRKTQERSSMSMVLEAPYQTNSSFSDPILPPRWRHMNSTRLDIVYAFREAYDTARKIKEKQDDYCSKTLANDWEGLGDFPENLQWEALVDVLRGRVKVNISCYESVDFDGIVRLSNEFKFPISAFHHASEAFLVPDLIKKTYGPTPAIALFATNARYKREAYRGSEFAPRILAEHGVTVLMKSDHPVMKSPYLLLYEAQQASFYAMDSLRTWRWIASITSNSASVMGMAHRIGYIKEGKSCLISHLIIWDSHPLALGATPKQVFNDGVPQLLHAHVVEKPETFQQTPPVPNFDKEAQAALVVFVNVQSVFAPSAAGVNQVFSAADAGALGAVLVKKGRITCVGVCRMDISDTKVIDLEGGSISPGLVSFGSPLGLEYIAAEDSTNDSPIHDRLTEKGVPDMIGGDGAMIRAADGLLFQTRDALLAYRAGVTSVIVAPTSQSALGGLGVSFSLGAAHRLQRGAVLHEVTGVHMAVRQSSGPSVSTQIALLRRLLLRPKVTNGEIPLVSEAHSADPIASLLLLKKEVEHAKGQTIQMTITGAAEAHLLAQELGEADVGVILNPARSFPYRWADRRVLAGPPLTEHTPISVLVAHNVTVGVGVLEVWDARNTRFDIAWASLSAGRKMSKAQVFALASTNLMQLLTGKLHIDREQGDMVATKGGDLLDFGTNVVAVVSPARGLVDIL
ncbi:carbohydrate esterase family 9 protein [Mycena belliarum]|uniref:Carbohydrate esterase family 9 protein n=1 Tax=Mycena belliarum TaxID=1033014 RepID=A0AAD6XTG5_9AGAR|nr:carbohydrate esterase family 9 protein [Mycena belliae]